MFLFRFRIGQPTDATVLVIGAGPSGMDLANEMSKVATRVSLSHHQNPEPKTHFGPNVDMRPDVARLTENGVVFVDGSEQTYSVIMYCTGYKYTFPFLSIDCGLSVDDNYVKPLYKHCININYPTMALIGVPFYVCASQMFDLQVNTIFVLFCIFLFFLPVFFIDAQSKLAQAALYTPIKCTIYKQIDFMIFLLCFFDYRFVL